MRGFSSKVVYALPIIFSLLLVDGEDEGGGEVEETDNDNGEPSESDEGVTSPSEVTWDANLKLDEDETPEPLTHEIGEDVSHEGSDSVDDGPLEDESNPTVAGKHVIMCYDVTEDDVTPEDDEEWNRQAQHDADTDANPRRIPTDVDEEDSNE